MQRDQISRAPPDHGGELEDAEVERVAGIAGRELQTVLTDLRAADFSASADSNLRAVAGPQRERQMQALGIVLVSR